MRTVFIRCIAGGRRAEGWEVDNEPAFLREPGVIGYTEMGKRILPETVTHEP